MNSLVTRIIALFLAALIGFGLVWAILVVSANDASSEYIKEEISVAPLSIEARVDTASRLKNLKSQIYPEQVSDLGIPDDPFDQKYEIATWVLSLDESRILDWLKQSVQAGWSVSTQFQTEFQSTLVQTLSQSSPEQALEFALARIEPVRSSLGSIVFFEWATNNLDEALEFAKSTSALSELDRHWVLHSILQSQGNATRLKQREIAKELGDEAYALTFYFQSLLEGTFDDPKQLWYEVVDLAVPNNRLHLDVLKVIVHEWIGQAGLKILDEVSTSTTDDDILHSLTFGVLMEHADVKEQTEEAFEYTLSLSDDTPFKVFTLNSVINKWAISDHVAVLDRAQSLPHSSYRELMLRQAHSEKARSDPKGTLENLAALPLDLLDSVSQLAIRTLAEEAPADAANLVLQIDDATLQKQLASTLVLRWRHTDLDATKNWILDLPAHEPLRDSLLALLPKASIETNP